MLNIKHGYIVGHCAFGIDTDMQNGLNNIYMQKTMVLCAIDPERLFIVKLYNVMPFLTPLLTQFVKIRTFIGNKLYKIVPSLMSNVQSLTAFWLIQQLEEVIKQRLTSGKMQPQRTKSRITMGMI